MMNATPIDIYRLSLSWTHLMVETQAVMTMRLMGMAGYWSVLPSEDSRMRGEKAPAFATSMVAAGAAAMAGKRPDQIAEAAIKPLRAKTRSNSRRLAKRGPKMP